MLQNRGASGYGGRDSAGSRPTRPDEPPDGAPAPALAVRAHAEAVAIGAGGRFEGLEARHHQRMGRAVTIVSAGPSGRDRRSSGTWCCSVTSVPAYLVLPRQAAKQRRRRVIPLNIDLPPSPCHRFRRLRRCAAAAPQEPALAFGPGVLMRRRPAPIELLLAALCDPASRNCTMLGCVGYALVWTLYPVVAKRTRTSTIIQRKSWCSRASWRSASGKHPPLAACGWWRAWLALFPVTDWAYHLLVGRERGSIVVDRLAAVGALPRRRETGGRAGFRHARGAPVLQFPCLEIQPEHGADAAVGGDDVVAFPAFARPDAPLRPCGTRRARSRWASMPPKYRPRRLPAGRARHRRACRPAGARPIFRLPRLG